MKKVGIIARSGENFEKSSMYMFDNYRIICLENNCLPVMIFPPQLKDYFRMSGPEIGKLKDQEKDYLKKCIDECDGIIIPGGDRWYDYDKFIYNYAYSKDKPILGICMGMQVMVNCDNDIMPIENKDGSHYRKKVDYVHSISIDKDSKLFSIIGKDKIQVNSYHNYHISQPNNLFVSALSDDGYIEAIEDKNKKFVIGVQWHPEIMYRYDDNMKKLMKAFISAL